MIFQEILYVSCWHETNSESQSGNSMLLFQRNQVTVRIVSRKLTANAPENLTKLKRKGLFANRHFSEAMLVAGSLYVVHFACQSFFSCNTDPYTLWGIGVSPQKTRAFLFSLAHGSHGYLGSISFPIPPMPATPRRAVPSRFWIGDMTRFFTRQLLNRPSPVRRRMAMCLGLNSTMLRVPRVFSCIPNGVGWPVGLGSCEIINGVSIPLPPPPPPV